MKDQEETWKNQDRQNQVRRRKQMQEMKQGLDAQLSEGKKQIRLNRKVDEMYGRMLKERDQIDLLREQEEKNKFKNQQKSLYNGLHDQNRLNTNRAKYSDMMSEQERRMNNANLEAYQRIPHMPTTRDKIAASYGGIQIPQKRNSEQRETVYRPSGNNGAYGDQIFIENPKQKTTSSTRGRNSSHSFSIPHASTQASPPAPSKPDSMSFIDMSAKLFGKAQIWNFNES
uniref:Uncharacterized protein n=1 Tax=Euplotes crassus TaxID=5936 RepID=A0A7S3NV86_EUPCR|mmetsp:Transcript_34828/g.34493  ORF Transcript_34828/g.34493 Transcript_34828/m.34493 type:complete len:228 (+) Transcript_34828:103-786(+)